MSFTARELSSWVSSWDGRLKEDLTRTRHKKPFLVHIFDTPPGFANWSGVMRSFGEIVNLLLFGTGDLR